MICVFGELDISPLKSSHFSFVSEFSQSFAVRVIK
jgi:hypothetical protein